MKKSILLLLITSIFFLQCFSPLEISKEEFLLDRGYEPLGLITKDNMKFLFKENMAMVQMEFDSLIYLSYAKVEPISQLPYWGTDTVNIKNIKSFYVNKFDGMKTLFLFTGIASLFLITIFISMSGSSGPVLSGSF